MCIDNVYLPFKIYRNGEETKTAYGEAKLKLTENSGQVSDRLEFQRNVSVVR